MIGQAALVQYTVPMKCTCTVNSKSSIDMLLNALSRRMPALFTRMSQRPQVFIAVSTMFCALFGVGDRIMVRHRLAAGGLDLGHHLVGDGVLTAAAIHRAARIVHHHLGAAACQQHGVRAAEAGTGAGDDGDAVVEADGHDAGSLLVG